MGGGRWLGAPTVRFEGGGTRGALYGCALGGCAGELLCVGGEDRCVRVWSVLGRRGHAWTLRGHRGPVLDVCAVGGSGVASASTDGSARVWDLTRGVCVKQMRGHGDGGVNAVAAWTPGVGAGPGQGPGEGGGDAHGAAMVATAGGDGVCGVWDARVRRAVGALPHTYPVLSIGWTRDGRGLVTGALDNVARVWDVRALSSGPGAAPTPVPGARVGVCVREVAKHGDSVTGVALSPCGRRGASNGADSEVHVWDAAHAIERTGEPEDGWTAQRLLGHVHSQERDLLRCAWSADGRKVAAGSADGLLNVWKVPSADAGNAAGAAPPPPMMPVWRLPGHAGTVTAVAFHPTRPNLIASVGTDGIAYVGELDDGERPAGGAPEGKRARIARPCLVA